MKRSLRKQHSSFHVFFIAIIQMTVNQLLKRAGDRSNKKFKLDLISG